MRHFPNLNEHLNYDYIEPIIVENALRKYYGIKAKNALLYSDTN